MVIEDAIVVGASSEEENHERPHRRTRKPSAKARQNEASQDLPDKTQLVSKNQLGGAPWKAAANGLSVTGNGDGVDNDRTILTILQKQSNEQTSILKALRDLQTEIGQVREELRAVKEECQSVKEQLQSANDELQLAKQQLEGMAVLTTGQNSVSPSYVDVARTPPTSLLSNIRTLSSLNTTPSAFIDSIYCTIDNSRVEDETSSQISAGAIRKSVEEGIRAKGDNPS
jgi:hypothetical protein